MAGRTKLSKIEKEYGVDFGQRKDMLLGDYLRKQGYPSLAKCLEVIDKNLENEPLPKRKQRK